MRIIHLLATVTIAISTALSAHGADLSSFNDEFNSSTTLTKWKRVHADYDAPSQLEKYDIGKTRKGWMTMVPYATTWYKEYRGVLAYKTITGDFIATTELEVSNRAGNGAPNKQFSLAGIMVRTPLAKQNSGNENYVFLSIGAANKPGQFQFEVKTTQRSNSKLKIKPTNSGKATIMVVRKGKAFIMLCKPDGGTWQVHNRYWRADMPATLQVGFTCYTDYPSASKKNAQEHNRTVNKYGDPDLIAQYNYMRFATPTVPRGITDRALMDANQFNDAQLINWFAESRTNPTKALGTPANDDPMMGIHIEPMGAAIRKNGLVSQLRVTALPPNSRLMKWGLRQGDVIESINGTPLSKGLGQGEFLMGILDGRIHTIAIRRDGVKVNLETKN